MDANIVITQFTAGAVAVWGIQQLKQATWFPFLQMEGTKWEKRLINIASAISAHTGIEHVWNPGISPGWHRVIIDIPPATVIVVSLWHWLGQYVMQEYMYQVAYNRPAAPATTPSVKAQTQ